MLYQHKKSSCFIYEELLLPVIKAIDHVITCMELKKVSKYSAGRRYSQAINAVVSTATVSRNEFMINPFISFYLCCHWVQLEHTP